MTNVTAGLKAVGQAGGVANFASGTYTGDGTAGAMTVNVGFSPKYVCVQNVTDSITIEWFLGMAATNTTTRIANGTSALDTTSAIVSNNAIATATEVAYPPPGTSSADDGTSGTTTVSYESPNKALPQLVFNAGSSGALMNVSAKVYVWMALG